jgi:hypothetical protein
MRLAEKLDWKELISADPSGLRSQAWVYGRSCAGIAGSYLADGIDVCFECLCCQAEISASGWSFVQKSPTDFGVYSGCDREATLGEAKTRNRVKAPKKKRINNNTLKKTVLLFYSSVFLAVSYMFRPYWAIISFN